VSAEISATSPTIDNGLAWNGDKGVYLVDDWNNNLYAVDGTTYARTLVKQLDAPYDGIIYVGAESHGVPEPGTLLLLGIGVLALATQLRCRD
jgi:hypothetical protein